MKLSPHAWGPLRIGMSPTEAERVFGTWSESTLDGPPEGACYLLTPAKYPAISVMVTDGQISRIDLDTKAFSTREGIRVGDSERKVKHTYGRRVAVRPHPYTDGHYIVFRSTRAARFGYVFETDGASVISIRAGKFPEIEFNEGCE